MRSPAASSNPDISNPDISNPAAARPAGAGPRERFWFPELPLGRIAALRVLANAFILLDLVWWTPFVRPHRDIPAFYQPLAIGRLLHLPTPTPHVVDIVELLLVLTAAASLVLAAGFARRTPPLLTRVLGVAAALLYGEWMVIAMSYGKVDHDRFALLVLLAVVATVGPASLGEKRRSEVAGWAVRCVQVAVVATYLLAAVAKFRFGGFGWVNGSTLVWAIIRRGTVLGDPLLHVRALLHVTQWGIVAMELGTPMLLVLDHLSRTGPAKHRRLAGRLCVAYLWGLVAFHLMTFATISILFLPHVVCLLAFAPLERAPEQWRVLRRRFASTPALSWIRSSA
ncbi:MAG TPA: hypothetical protein VLR26_13810 [Frankiaceae bacterium]|nr:hypothetical protein [Frankiaceae bacterium]